MAARIGNFFNVRVYVNACDCARGLKNTAGKSALKKSTLEQTNKQKQNNNKTTTTKKQKQKDNNNKISAPWSRTRVSAAPRFAVSCRERFATPTSHNMIHTNMITYYRFQLECQQSLLLVVLFVIIQLLFQHDSGPVKNNKISLVFLQSEIYTDT